MTFRKNGKPNAGNIEPERAVLPGFAAGGILAVIFFGSILFSEGCGRKGDPVAPEERGPKRMLQTG